MNWRALSINLLLVLAVAAAGAVVCRAMGIEVHARELTAAAVTFLLSAEVSVALALFRRNPSPVEAAQAALISLVLHLGLSVVLSAALLLTHQVRSPFIWWAMAMFWATLIGVSAVLIRLVRSASAAYVATHDPAQAAQPHAGASVGGAGARP